MPFHPASDLRLKIHGMDCGSCADTIERALQGLPGVTRVRVEFTTETLEIQGSATREQIAARVQRLGYRVADENAPAPALRPEWRGGAGRDFSAF